MLVPVRDLLPGDIVTYLGCVRLVVFVKKMKRVVCTMPSYIITYVDSTKHSAEVAGIEYPENFVICPEEYERYVDA
jgi:hypothetical protein